MKALLEYLEKINAKYGYRKVSLTKEEDMEKSIVRDTYMQLLAAKNTRKIEVKEEQKEDLKKAS